MEVELTCVWCGEESVESEVIDSLEKAVNWITKHMMSCGPVDEDLEDDEDDE